MISLQAYVRQGRHTLRRWAVDPRLHVLAQAAAYLLCGFVLSAASLSHRAMPLALGFVLGCSGWSAVLAALGGGLGYYVFWGQAGTQPILWLAVGLAVALVLVDKRISRQTPLLLPAIAGLLVAAAGLTFQIGWQDDTPTGLYLLRVALAAGSAGLFYQILRERNPILDWLTCGLAVLALAQIAPLPWLNLGYIAAGALAVAGAFPAVALAGLALDLAQLSPAPMTAALCLSFLVRLLPRYPKGLGLLAPAGMYLMTMGLCGALQMQPLVPLLLGGILGRFLPGPGQATHRRGETGVAQVRLEMAASVLAQTEQLLLEAPTVPIDEDALVCRAAERACSGCPCRKSCPDSKRIAQLPGLLLHKPLLTAQEMPINCRKSGRFLAELHRSQEQLRSIRADRERQREYRAAVLQQYRFLAEFLRDLSDQLARRTDSLQAVYQPQVRVYGNRPEPDNGDRCLRFAGTMCKYYVILCDGMGTGLGAVQEGKTAGTLLRRLLSAGYPAEYALRSLNSLCALRNRAGAVTVDMVELQLDSGRATLYKWGAPASFLVSKLVAEKLGTAGPPPGLSVTDCQETAQRLSLRRGEILVLVSDGIGEEEALRCCQNGLGLPPGELAAGLIGNAWTSGEDDATAVTIRLDSPKADIS